MNRDRKILLLILFLTIVISTVSIFTFNIREKHQHVIDRILLVENNLNKIVQNGSVISFEEKNYYLDEISKEESRYFVIDEVDPFKFAIEIKYLLESKNLIVNSYKSIESKDNFYIEFSIEGRSISLFNFLKELEKMKKNYLIPLLSIKNEKQGISSVFRIGYMIHE